MASINFDVYSNSFENKSQVVLRTNPDLTSNVKLVVDSDGSLYLDSISANRVLANKRYKKYSLDQNGHYAYDLAKFYKDTPTDRVFETLRRDSDNSVYRDYEKQYEEQYQYGARLNESKLFQDNIRFTAPLWLDKELPSYFVVYRIDEPVSQVSLTDSYDGINARVMQMLKNATIVKVFDMGKESQIGKYLNNYINDTKFPYAPLTISFDRADKTSWNGIDLVKGGFTSKGEYIYTDLVEKDRQEMLNNQFITEGFKRNKMVCANLINMEFIFDDPSVEAYDVNRYVGFYVRAHEEGGFKAIEYRKEVLRVDAGSIYYNHELPAGLLAEDMLPEAELDVPTLNWVNCRGEYFHVANENIGSYRLKLTGFEGKEFGGKVKKKETLKIDSALPALKDFIKLEIVDNPINGERWVMASKSEYLSNPDINAFTVTADNSLDAGTVNGVRFSRKGKPEQVAYAFAQAINNIEDNPFIVTVNNNVIVIEHNSIGNRLYRSFFAEHNSNISNAINVAVGGYDNVDAKLDLGAIYTNWNVYYPIGGSDAGVGFLVSESEIGDIDTNTYVKAGEKYVQIIDIVADPYYAGLYRVCLRANHLDPNLLYATSTNMYVDDYFTYGKFEAFDFIDLDFDFHSTLHSQPKELLYEGSDYTSEVTDDHVSDPTKLTEDWNTYFKQLEGVKQAVTPTSSGIVTVESEYDRLQENYLKETSTISRVVPTINKWKYKDAVNTRENPYLLTVSEAFGTTNFAPNLRVSGRDPQNLTHEWFYLYNMPNYLASPMVDQAEIAKSLYSYIQPDISIGFDLTSLTRVDENWFDRLFVYEGLEDVDWIPVRPEQKYTRFIKGSNIAPAETMFRGLKVKAFGRKEFTENNPRNLINTADFNDYKFSAMMVYNYMQSDDALNIYAIQNKKWKTITILFEVNSKEEIVSFLNRKALYEMSNFLQDLTPTYTDILLTGHLDLSTASTASGGRTTVIGVDSDLVREIQVDSGGSYGSIYFDFGGYTFVMPIIDILSDTSILIQTNDLGKVRDTTDSIDLALNSVSSIDSEGIDFIYNGGGYNLAKSTFESLSAQAIAELFNQNDTEKIQYITVEEDGTQLADRFILNIEGGNDINKTSSLILEADPNKPKSYKVSSGIVGYINTETTPKNVVLNRMSGDYTPSYRKVVSFTDIYKEYKLDRSPYTIEELKAHTLYKIYNRLGIAFGSYGNFGYDDFGLIKNSYFHKVNPEKADGILKLTNSGDALPVYPLINEIAIDKRDMNVFRSSWEDGFYVKNDTQSSRTFVFGTLSAHEESTFLASTLNLPRDAYNVTSYDAIFRASSLENMKQIKDIKNYLGDAVIFEDDSNVWIDLYLKNTLVEQMITDGAGKSIIKYVNASDSYGDKSTLEDDIKQYVEVNLLKLMGIEEVRIWTNKSKAISESQLLTADSLSTILNTTFVEEKSFRLEFDTNNPLNVRLIYNKRPGFRHQFYVYVKISS